MRLTTENRTLITARQAAEILGCSMVRVRQLCQSGQLWSTMPGQRMRLLDAAEVQQLAAERAAARAAGTLPGPAPGGFSPH
jgi:excisionase family DNA binding protein